MGRPTNAPQIEPVLDQAINARYITLTMPFFYLPPPPVKNDCCNRTVWIPQCLELMALILYNFTQILLYDG